ATGSWWAKRWEGRMGRWLTSLASIKLGDRAAVADRPTEMAIVFSARALFDALPKPLRQSLGDVPAVLDQMEQQARAMRDHIRELDASLTEAHLIGVPSSETPDRRTQLIGRLEEERARASEQLAELVSSLEVMRLDLLRLRAGQGSAESITESLRGARALGDDVDRLLSGQGEVDMLFGEPGREPTPVCA